MRFSFPTAITFAIIVKTPFFNFLRHFLIGETGVSSICFLIGETGVSSICYFSNIRLRKIVDFFIIIAVL